VHISQYCWQVPVRLNFIFGTRGQLTDIITYIKFLVNRFRITEFWHPDIIISHWLVLPLQQCTHCRATLWQRLNSSR